MDQYNFLAGMYSYYRRSYYDNYLQHVHYFENYYHYMKSMYEHINHMSSNFCGPSGALPPPLMPPPTPPPPPPPPPLSATATATAATTSSSLPSAAHCQYVNDEYEAYVDAFIERLNERVCQKRAQMTASTSNSKSSSSSSSSSSQQSAVSSSSQRATPGPFERVGATSFGYQAKKQAPNCNVSSNACPNNIQYANAAQPVKTPRRPSSSCATVEAKTKSSSMIMSKKPSAFRIRRSSSSSGSSFSTMRSVTKMTTTTETSKSLLKLDTARINRIKFLGIVNADPNDYLKSQKAQQQQQKQKKLPSQASATPVPTATVDSTVAAAAAATDMVAPVANHNKSKNSPESIRKRLATLGSKFTASITPKLPRIPEKSSDESRRVKIFKLVTESSGQMALVEVIE